MPPRLTSGSRRVVICRMQTKPNGLYALPQRPGASREMPDHASLTALIAVPCPHKEIQKCRRSRQPRRERTSPRCRSLPSRRENSERKALLRKALGETMRSRSNLTAERRDEGAERIGSPHASMTREPEAHARNGRHFRAPVAARAAGCMTRQEASSRHQRTMRKNRKPPRSKAGRPMAVLVKRRREAKPWGMGAKPIACAPIADEAALFARYAGS